MKAFNVKLLVATIVIAACTFVSCKKSKDAPTPQSKMEGTWDGLYGVGNEAPAVYFSFIIKKDGTLQVRAEDKNNPMKGKGTWSLKEDVLTVVYQYDEQENKFNVSAKFDEGEMKITGSWGYGEKDANAGDFYMNKQ